MSRLRLLTTTLVAAAALALPATTMARPGPGAEPVLVIPGLGSNCVSQKVDSAANPALAGAVSAGMDAARSAYGPGAVAPVPASQVVGWSFSACGRTLSILAQQLDQAITRLRIQTGATQVDLVSFSLGGAIARYCLTNPLGATPHCAAHVDDWVGLVNATHGTTKADAKTCLTAALVQLWPICSALAPGSPFLRRMDRGDPSPGDVEYTMFWSPNDEYILPKASSRLPGARNVSTTSPLGPVSHVGIWLGGTCSTTAEYVGAELLDLAPHVVGDDAIDCSRPLAATLAPLAP